MSHTPPDSDPPKIEFLASDLVRLPDGRLEASFDLDLGSEPRVDWLKARDWLRAKFGAVFSKGVLCPVTGVWQARVAFEGATAFLRCTDFPDELVLLAESSASNATIVAVHAALQTERATLFDLSGMDVSAFRAWMTALTES